MRTRVIPHGVGSAIRRGFSALVGALILVGILPAVHASAATPSASIDDVSVVEGNAGIVQVVFTVSLDLAPTHPARVKFTTADDTASSPSDYVAATGTLSFSRNRTTRMVTITANADTLFEGDETFFVDLSNPKRLTIADGQGVGTLQNDDQLPAASIDSVSVVEGDLGTSTAIFTVSLSNPTDEAATIDFATADDIAVEPTDYTAVSDTLTFVPGDVSEEIQVSVNGDTANESNETFFVDLSNESGVTLADPEGIGTIVDDDPPHILIEDVSVVEGDAGSTVASFTVWMDQADSGTVTVNYATANDTAAEPADYTGATGTVTFLPNDVSETVEVDVQGDLIDEPDEIFVVNLSDAAGAAIVDDRGEGTITDDDKGATTTTLRIRKRPARILVRGTLTPAHEGDQMVVTLQKKVGGRFVRVSRKLVALGAAVDPDGDGIFLSRYSTRFHRPASGRVRVLARFAGDADHLASSAYRTFRV